MLKKLVTIVMLLLLLYNSAGYFIVFKIRHDRVEKEIAAYISSGNYTESDLTLFKVPLHQYVESTSRDFNRVKGDFEYQGQFYEMVRERMENDTMYIYCLKNEKELQLYAELSEHVQTHLVDGKAQKQNKTEKAFKDLSKEYLTKGRPTVHKISPLIAQLEYSNISVTFLPDISISVSTPPPEFI